MSYTSDTRWLELDCGLPNKRNIRKLEIKNEKSIRVFTWQVGQSKRLVKGGQRRIA